MDHAPSWSAAVHATPAGVTGLDGRGVRAGLPADLVLISARHPHALLARPQSDRIALRRGRVLDARLPDLAALDGVATHPTQGASA